MAVRIVAANASLPQQAQPEVTGPIVQQPPADLPKPASSPIIPPLSAPWRRPGSRSSNAANSR